MVEVLTYAKVKYNILFQNKVANNNDKTFKIGCDKEEEKVQLNKVFDIGY